ncbi:MAG: bifunctional molybdenum cofactor biosynthesis protein MoaC/MoaB [Armatimonadetes bacterium]|nr:bifunctional molybdenum cofactor biosynthesis protein MoaC/MoaB [Armatimonadota bacterium]
MFDISRKIFTARQATAEATLTIAASTRDAIARGQVPKGDPLSVARVAAIQAAKNTSQIIPYCHPLPTEYAGVEFEVGEKSIRVQATIKTTYKTGVEVEALTAASVAALTLYDMLKMLDDTMEIQSVRLISKKGGKGDFRDNFDRELSAAVLVMSDTVSSGQKEDRSGRLIVDRLQHEGLRVEEYQVIPDDTDAIRRALERFADELHLDLIVTTGGTGFSPRDTTPEAMNGLFDREIPGIAEALRAYGQERTPYSMLSRGRSGIRGNSLIINLPGSSNGVSESLDMLFPAILHAFPMLWGGKHPPEH